MMPGMDGLEVLRALRSEPGCANLPVVLLGARGSGLEILEGRHSGADYYITKPFQMEELLDFIGQVRVRGQDGERPHEADIALHQTDNPVPGH